MAGRGDLADHTLPTISLLMLGDSLVGKTSLLNRYCDDRFLLATAPTFGVEFKTKVVEVDDGPVKIQVWDTAGQERFRTMTPQYYRSANGIVLTYDVTNVDTFKNVEYWLGQIDMHNKTGVRRILVGNKIDLAGRKVATEEGEALAKKFDLDFFEVSAKTPTNVKEAFDSLVEQIARSKWPKAPDTLTLKPLAPTASWRTACCVSS